VNPIDLVTGPMAYGFMQRGMLAALMVGVVCAVMGTFVVLKGLAFIGDAVSHAAFPGLVIAFMLGIPLYVGGSVAAVGTALAIGWVARNSGLRWDLLGYLLGNVLGITQGDLIQLAVLGLLVLLVVAVLRKELLYATFDPLGAAASGLRVGPLEYLLLALLGVTIVVGIQTVGIILVVAMLVTPAATAQLVVTRFDRLVLLAVALAIVSVIGGLYVSFYWNLAAGATIVMFETLLFALALLLGPRTGILRLRRERSATAVPLTPGTAR